MTARDHGPAEDATGLETPWDRMGATRRRFLSLAGVSAGAAGLAACAAGGGGGDESSDGGGGAVAEGGGDVSDDNPFGVDASAPVDVVIFNGGFGDQYGKDAGDKYKEMYPEADVKVDSTVNIQPDLQPRFIGGNPPDLFDNSGAQSMNTSALISDGSLGELGAQRDRLGRRGLALLEQREKASGGVADALGRGAHSGLLVLVIDT